MQASTKTTSRVSKKNSSKSKRHRWSRSFMSALPLLVPKMMASKVRKTPTTPPSCSSIRWKSVVVSSAGKKGTSCMFSTGRPISSVDFRPYCPQGVRNQNKNEIHLQQNENQRPSWTNTKNAAPTVSTLKAATSTPTATPPKAAASMFASCSPETQFGGNCYESKESNNAIPAWIHHSRRGFSSRTKPDVSKLKPWASVQSVSTTEQRPFYPQLQLQQPQQKPQYFPSQESHQEQQQQQQQHSGPNSTHSVPCQLPSFGILVQSIADGQERTRLRRGQISPIRMLETLSTPMQETEVQRY